MSATNFRTKNETFRKLNGNGLVYRTPRFQRDYSWTETEELTYRLGNMTLLESNANRELGNQGYGIKRKTYKQSSFQITSKAGEENADWNAERLANRQRWMAKQATSIWSIGAFSE